MASSPVTLPSLTIPNGSDVSNWLTSTGDYGDAVGLAIYAPASLDAHTYVIECAPISGSPISVFQQGDSGATADCTPPGAGKARVYYDLPALGMIRIKDQSGNVAAAREFKVAKLISLP